MKLTAVHYIQRRDKDGKRADAKPGQAFDAEKAEADFLLKVGAARKASGKTDEPAVEKDETNDEPELKDMTKAELIQFAVDNEIEIDSGANKADVLATIEAAQAGDDLV